MWNVVLKLVGQLLIAKFLRSRGSNAHSYPGSSTHQQFTAVKHNLAALVESRAALFKAQFHCDMQRVKKSLLGLAFIFFAILFSGLTALMWLFAYAWNSANRDIILGIIMILPLLIALGIFFAIRSTWKKQPLFAKSVVQIENDWQVFKDGLNNHADTSEETNR